MTVRSSTALRDNFGVALAVLLLGALFAGVGAFLARDTVRLSRVGQPAEGRVMDITLTESRNDDGDLERHYYSVVEFLTAQEEKIRFTDAVGYGRPAHTVGQTVSVLYDPADPHTARINSLWGLWGFPGIFLGIGGAVLAFSAALFVQAVRAVMRR